MTAKLDQPAECAVAPGGGGAAGATATVPAADVPGEPAIPPAARHAEGVAPAADHPGAVEAHRATRVLRLKLAVLTSVLSRPLGAVISFVTIPLFLRALGPERFGLYESVGALAAWLGLTNVGLGLGLQNRLQDCFVAGDRRLARAYVSSTFVALAAVAVMGLLLLTALVPALDWAGKIFPTADPRAARELPWAVWTAGAVVLLGVAGGAPYVIYTAQQELHVANLWEAGSKLTILAACCLAGWAAAAGHLPLSIAGAVVAASGVGLLVRLVNNLTMFFREKPWLRPSLRLFEWRLLRATMGEGLLLFLLQLGTLAIFHADKVVITNRLGAPAVVGYAVLGRLFLVVYGMMLLVQWPLWPAYGEAIRRGDRVWAARMIKLSTALAIGGMLACGVGLWFFQEPLLKLLAPKGQAAEVAVSRSLVVAMTAFFACRLWADCHSVPLNAAGILRPQVAVLLGNGILNVALAFALVGPFGVEGVAWAFPITAAVTTVWGYPWLVRKYLFGKLPMGGKQEG